VAVSSFRSKISVEPRKILNIVVLAAPMLAFLGAIVAVVFWEQRVTWLDVALCLGMYVLTICGITVGFHRLFSHRAFQTNAIVRGFLAIAGSMAAQGTVSSWVSHHRQHHLYSDTPGDTHSPHLHGEGLGGWLQGFWHAHIGWMLVADWQEFPYINDLKRDRVIQTIDRLYPVWLILSFAIPAAIGGAISGSWDGALRGVLWGGVFRLMLAFQVTFSINSLCHLWGRRRFATEDRSRNNALFGWLNLGEGWHNNHHAFPFSAKLGLMWWQVDIGWWFIALCQRLGLAWEVKLPSQLDMEKKAISL
jgi:stearoyl-CoA desaturase (delta-9 desaturase)